MAKPKDELSFYILLCVIRNRTILHRVSTLAKSKRSAFEPGLLRLVRVVEWATDCLRGNHQVRRSPTPSRDFDKRHSRAFRAFNIALRDGARVPDYERLVPLKFSDKPDSLWCKAGTLALAVVAFCAAERSRVRRRAPRGLFPAPDLIDRTLASRYRQSLLRSLLERGLS